MQPAPGHAAVQLTAKHLLAIFGGFQQPLQVDQRHVYRRVDAVTWMVVGAGEDVVWSTEAPGVAVMRLRHR